MPKDNCYLAATVTATGSHNPGMMDRAALNSALAEIGYSLPDACEGIHLHTGYILRPSQVHAALANNGRLSQPMAAALSMFVKLTRVLQANGGAGKI